MMKLRTFLLLFSSILFLHCGSSVLPFTPLKKPIAISQPSQDILYQNDTTRLLYVADQFTQSLVVIDTLREELVDTADEDDFDFTGRFHSLKIEFEQQLQEEARLNALIQEQLAKVVV